MQAVPASQAGLLCAPTRVAHRVNWPWEYEVPKCRSSTPVAPLLLQSLTTVEYEGKALHDGSSLRIVEPAVAAGFAEFLGYRRSHGSHGAFHFYKHAVTYVPWRPVARTIKHCDCPLPSLYDDTNSVPSHGARAMPVLRGSIEGCGCPMEPRLCRSRQAQRCSSSTLERRKEARRADARGYNEPDSPDLRLPSLFFSNISRFLA